MLSILAGTAQLKRRTGIFSCVIFLAFSGIAGAGLQGGVGLWGSPDQESYSPTCASLTRTGSRSRMGARPPVRGKSNTRATWARSPAMGTDLPVAGVWRNGYLELTFHGTWTGQDPGRRPRDLPDGSTAMPRRVA